MGFLDFADGDTFDASAADALMRQGIIPFVSAAARTSALSGLEVTGMVTYATAETSYERWNGSAWEPFHPARFVQAVTQTGTITTSTSRGTYTSILDPITVPAGTYALRGFIRKVGAGTQFRYRAFGTATYSGFWKDARGKTGSDSGDAESGDITSVDPWVLKVSADGAGAFDGTVIVTVAGTFGVGAYNADGATAATGSYFLLDRLL